MKVVLVVERSGLVAADIEECIREAQLDARIFYARSLACASFIAQTAQRIDIAIVTSFADRLPESPFGKWLEKSGTEVIVGMAPLGEATEARDGLHCLPSPFTSRALSELLKGISVAGDVTTGSVRP